jgi:hypothetical protein
MRRVSISAKTARALLCVAKDSAFTSDNMRAINELERALTPKRSVIASKKRRETKKATKREEASAIREAVFARANGWCECGCAGVAFSDFDPGELDHFWGRGKERQTVENCWALVRMHHCSKTDGFPGRADWLKAFAGHCAKHGYYKDMAKARNQLAALEMSRGVAR